MTQPVSQRPRNDTRRLLDNQRSEVVIADMGSGTTTVIYDSNQLIEAPNWSADGKWLVFNADGRLFRLSPDGLEGPHRILTAPIENANNDHVLSPDGGLIYISSNDGHIYKCPFEGGTPERVSHDLEANRNYRFYLHGISPDGAQLTYVGLERRSDKSIMTRIATLPASGGAATHLTDGSCPVDGPEYSPDGQWIYFNSEAVAKRPGHAQIFRMRIDGSGVEQMTHDERVNWFPHISPDGQTMAYISFPTGVEGHPADCDVIIRTMPANGGLSRDIDQFNGGQGSINVPSWAPDSQRFAYIRYPFEG
jgi:Tol biopolymer transport system component